MERIKSVFAPQVKAIPQKLVLWPTWKEGQPEWQMTDLSAYIEEGFNANALIYSAIMFKVRAAYTAALRGYKGTRDEPVLLPYGNELSLLVDRPNHFQSFAELQAEMIVYFNLMGNAYIWFNNRSGSEYPKSFYNLRPDWVHHIYAKKELKGYVYAPDGMALTDGTPLLPQDVMHVRLPNPGDPYAGMGKGLSPIMPAAWSADVDNSATKWLKKFFDEGAMPRYMLSVDSPLTQQIIDEGTEAWMDRYGGNSNWMKPLIMGRGATATRVGSTFAELDMGGLDARNESRMVMPFGVPLTLIESRPELVQSTYNNKEADYTMFLKTTLIPELEMFEQEWRYYLRSTDGTQFAQYDMDNVPGYIDKNLKLAQVQAAWDNGAATRREYRHLLGLPVTPADDVYKIPVMSSVMVASQAMPRAPQTESGSDSSSEDEGANKSLDDEHHRASKALSRDKKLKIGRMLDRGAVAWEAKYREAAAKQFERDRREVLAIIRESQKSAYKEAKSIEWLSIMMEVAAYLQKQSADKWRSTFVPITSATITEQGKNLNAAFGMQFDVRNLLAEDWYQSYMMQFADPITNTSNEELHDIFARGLAEGWSVPTMQKAVNLTFDQWIKGNVNADDIHFALDRLPPHRTEMIARTETMRASNAGANALYKDWGVHQKEWLATTGDNRTRPTHLAANGQVVNIDSYFTVGGASLKHPGDPSGPLEETINCRCTELPVVVLPGDEELPAIEGLETVAIGAQ